MEKTYSLLIHKVLICIMVMVTYLSTPGNTIKSKLVYKLTMERTSIAGAILECKKNGGYLAPMDSPFTPHLISVMADLYRQKKLEAQHKLTVGIRWIPEENNWTWIHDDSVVPEEIVNYWQLPKTPSQNFCTCLWLGANKTWTVGPFSCGPEHRAICRYDKGACSYTKCPGNALLPLDPNKGLTQSANRTAQGCEDTCSGYVSTNMSCVGYSYNTFTSECVLQLSSIWPIWTSSNLQADFMWEATIVNCLEIMYVAQVKPLKEYLVYPLENTKLCKTPQVVPEEREVLITVTEIGSNTGDGSFEYSDTENPAATSPALVSDWITTGTSRVSESNTEKMVPHQAAYTSRIVSETSLAYTTTTRVTEAVVEKTTTAHIVDVNTSYQSVTTPDYIAEKSSETPSVFTVSAVSSEEEIETTVSEANDNECFCMCGKGDNLTKEEKEAWTAELVGNLTIDVKKTGCYIRRKISIDDPRPSAQGCGYVAISILSTVLGILVCMDSTTMCATFSARRCRNF